MGNKSDKPSAQSADENLQSILRALLVTVQDIQVRQAEILAIVAPGANAGTVLEAKTQAIATTNAQLAPVLKQIEELP